PRARVKEITRGAVTCVTPPPGGGQKSGALGFRTGWVVDKRPAQNSGDFFYLRREINPRGTNMLKSPLPRSRTAPQFVSGRTARALLDLSPSGFRSWRRRGLLPAPVPGSPLDEPRWEWAELRS